MSHSWWAGRRVLVTGGGGFLGSHVLEALQAAGADQLAAPRSREYDLRDLAQVRRLYEAVRPQVVLHLAARVGGIGANQRHPSDFFYDNALMGLLLIEEARRRGVEKFVCLGTVCSYPKFTPAPFNESSLWDGYPEETNAPYGLAKKMLLVQLQAARQQYGFRGIYLIPENLYGPRDNFDLEDSHVVPAIIRKCLEAKQRGEPRVIAWGTGQVTREFLFVRDAAQGIVTAAERYDDPQPVNLGSGEEIAIRDLVALIATAVGYTGEIVWDGSKPDGQPRRRVDASRAAQAFGWRAVTPLREGLMRTVEWYADHCRQAQPAAPNMRDVLPGMDRYAA